jgi:hypothetical protein
MDQGLRLGMNNEGLFANPMRQLRDHNLFLLWNP